MEWSIIAALAVGVLALAGLLVWKAKHQPGSVPGRFDFDGYKAGELNKRGLFDRTKWR